MQEQDRYVSPFSTRYASDEMQRLFSARHRAELWRRLWVILAEAEHELGLPVTASGLVLPCGATCRWDCGFAPPVAD